MVAGDRKERIWLTSAGGFSWLFVARAPNVFKVCRVFVASLVFVSSQQSFAADHALSCCADLDQRIAKLEALSARNGKRGVEVKVSGSVNHAILAWDDGVSRDAAMVTNDNDNSTATVEGQTEAIGGGWSVGFVFDLDILNAGSGELSQSTPGRIASIEAGEVSVWVKNEQLGQLTVGLTSAKGSSGGANEADLSRTEVAGYVGITDIGGAFFLSRAGAGESNGLTNVTWDRLIDSLDQPDGTIIAYNSPEFAGFSVSALWGVNDDWNIGLGYTNDAIGPFSFVARAAVNEDVEVQKDTSRAERTVSGSVALLHVPAGLSIAVAGGSRNYIGATTFNDGRFGTPESPYFGYLKAGWRAELLSTGETAFYAEYGRFRNFLSQDADVETVAGLAGLDSTVVCAGAGAACLISASDATVWGAGVVQHLDQTGVQLYLGYRHVDPSVRLSDNQGAPVGPVPLKSFETLIGGLLIEF